MPKEARPGGKPIPFDDALKRLLATKPKPRKKQAAGKRRTKPSKKSSNHG